MADPWGDRWRTTGWETEVLGLTILTLGASATIMPLPHLCLLTLGIRCSPPAKKTVTSSRSLLVPLSLSLQLHSSASSIPAPHPVQRQHVLSSLTHLFSHFALPSASPLCFCLPRRFQLCSSLAHLKNSTKTLKPLSPFLSQHHG